MCWQSSPKDKLLQLFFFSFKQILFNRESIDFSPRSIALYFWRFSAANPFISLNYCVSIWLLIGLFEGRWVDKANGPKCTPIVCKNVCVTSICKWRRLGGRGEKRRTASAAHGRISHHAWLISTWYLKGMCFFLLFESLLFDGEFVFKTVHVLFFYCEFFVKLELLWSHHL